MSANWVDYCSGGHETSKKAKEAYNQRFRRAFKKVEKSQDSR
jgi:hypothetical protein